MGLDNSLSLTMTGFISGPKSIMFGEKPYMRECSECLTS